MSLLVVGSVALDSVETPEARATTCWAVRPSISPTPPATSRPVRLVSVVGDDWPAEHTRAAPQAASIDTAGLEVVPGAKTFRWRGKYLPNMNDRETLDVQSERLRASSIRCCPRQPPQQSSCSWPTARRPCS